MTRWLSLHDSLCERVAGLAPEPVAVRILEVLRNERSPVQSLADVITTDPLLAARMLRLANFAAGQPQRLVTVSHAITVMGLDALKSLALALTLFPLHPIPNKRDRSDSDGGLITLRELWEHSIGCAAVAARIATQVDHVSPRQAFAAGFLHDMGRLLLYRCSTEGFYSSITVASDSARTCYGLNGTIVDSMLTTADAKADDFDALVICGGLGKTKFETIQQQG
jgi:HD-like signal output (HDOD) protein